MSWRQTIILKWTVVSRKIDCEKREITDKCTTRTRAGGKFATLQTCLQTLQTVCENPHTFSLRVCSKYYNDAKKAKSLFSLSLPFNINPILRLMR